MRGKYFITFETILFLLLPIQIMCFVCIHVICVVYCAHLFNDPCNVEMRYIEG